ncbi:3'-5' exonuclease [Gimesia fumaroli]|nr:3'-5' exonuclease [Gimesia fumaroli]
MMSQFKEEFSWYPYFLIIDLEATCCNQQSVPRNEMEIIEIGAVMVDYDSLSAVDEFQTFIQPVRHPQLTPFCTELTSIQQSDVDDAPLFAAAINLLKEWMASYEPALFCSWGDYDKSQFEQDCRYHQIPYPFPSAHLNLKTQFSRSQGYSKKYGMTGALKRAGISLEGTHHRGIDDARNMARLMPWIVGKK